MTCLLAKGAIHDFTETVADTAADLPGEDELRELDGRLAGLFDKET